MRAENGVAARVGTVRVLICDDHPRMRAGVRGGLKGEPNVEVVGEAADGVEAVSKALQLKPDVVLMDLQMPRMDGVEAIARIKESLHPETKSLVFTTFDDDPRVGRAIKEGAMGVLLKDADNEQIVDALTKVANGQVYLHPGVHGQLARLVQGSDDRELTERDREILELIALGHPDKEIGKQLWIAPTTVNDHVKKSILPKLGVSNRAAAVDAGYKQGYLRT